VVPRLEHLEVCAEFLVEAGCGGRICPMAEHGLPAHVAIVDSLYASKVRQEQLFYARGFTG
jgi:hypothetical protein